MEAVQVNGKGKAIKFRGEFGFEAGEKEKIKFQLVDLRSPFHARI